MSVVDRFQLLDGGRTLRFSDLPKRTGIIDVAEAGAAGVLGAMMTGEAWLMRDRNGEPIPKVRGTKSPHIGLQTSGTTGRPKWAVTTLDRLGAKLKPGKGDQARWLLTFNPGSFAGVQVMLSAMVGGHVLVAPPYGASAADMAVLAGETGVTHISGTPTFWRAFLMALGDRPLDLKSLTLGGEAADQAILDALHARFPAAIIRHIYATTEVGRVFSVKDGRAGFPSDFLKGRLSLSPDNTLVVAGHDTGDVVEVVGNRVLFRGRRDAMVNVGGVKVFPETVEAHLLQSPFVQDVRVSARPNPITGHILTADIVLKPFAGDHDTDPAEAIRAHVASLPRSQRPASIRYVDAIDAGATGKKLRT